jgi:AGZA family xanthine/uracil permease-like MFS transporter
MCSQAFEATPRRHAPAVVMGLIPAISAYGALLVKRAYASVGVGTADNPIPATLIEDFTASTGFYAEGLFALESGYIYTSMFLAAGTVWIIEKRFKAAGLWFTAAAAFSALGLVHGYSVEPANILSVLSPAIQWALGYGLLATICFAVPILSDYREPATLSHAERLAVDHPESHLNGAVAPNLPSASPQGIRKTAPGPQGTPDPSASCP